MSDTGGIVFAILIFAVIGAVLSARKNRSAVQGFIVGGLLNVVGIIHIMSTALPVSARNSRLAAKTADGSTHELTVTNAKMWPRCGHGDRREAEQARWRRAKLLVSSEDIDARWNSLGAARKRTIIALLFDQILIRPVGKGLRRFDPASVSVRWREHAAVEPDV